MQQGLTEQQERDAIEESRQRWHSDRAAQLRVLLARAMVRNLQAAGYSLAAALDEVQSNPPLVRVVDDE